LSEKILIGTMATDGISKPSQLAWKYLNLAVISTDRCKTLVNLSAGVSDCNV
jgi:hypothetical protein